MVEAVSIKVHIQNKKGIERLEMMLLNNVLSDPDMKFFREKLRVSKSFITCAADSGSEEEVLHCILSVLAESEYLEEVKL